MMLEKLILLCCMFGFAVGTVSAHKPNCSNIYLQIRDTSVDGRWEIELADLRKALAETLDPVVITPDNLDTFRDTATAYLVERLTFSAAGMEYTLKPTGDRIWQLDSANYLVIEFALPDITQTPEVIDVHYSAVFDKDSTHRGLLMEEYNWKSGKFNNEGSISLIFTPTDQNQSLDLTSGSVMKGFVAVMMLGVHHILEGIDHIFFLIALMLPAVLSRTDKGWESTKKFRSILIDVIKIATCFTVAHSVTLALAALRVVSLPSRLVESIIAASIAVAACDILYPIFSRKVIFYVFGFGLFHGFGFAGVLEELGVFGDHTIAALFGFNLGVEIGQVGIICVVVPILFLLSRSRFYIRYFLKPGAIFLIAISTMWCLEIVFDYPISLVEIVTQPFQN